MGSRLTISRLSLGLLITTPSCSGESDDSKHDSRDAGTDSASADAAITDGAADQSAPDADANTFCAPASTETCYDGPTPTADVGACKSGIRICAADGSKFGDCVGEVTPTSETCGTPIDDDCDGLVNEEGADCACEPGSAANCYSGPASTLGVGNCKGGTQVCKPDGQGYGACLGEVTPNAETCTTPVDDDCDGVPNEDGAGCVCTPDKLESCYSGPVGTHNVGMCKTGTRACNSLGTAWGPCIGEVLPGGEVCSTPGDDDCDGQANEEGSDCACVPGAQIVCYTGPAQTLGVGLCKAGTQTCNWLGTGFGKCEQEVTPTTESCTAFGDEDCDNQPECTGDAMWAITYPGSSKFHDAHYNNGLISVLFTMSGNQVPRLVSFDPNGVVVNTFQLPAGSYPGSIGGTWSAQGVAGLYDGTVDFGKGPVPSTVGKGLFLVGYAQTWAVDWVKAYPTTLPSTFEEPIHVTGGYQELIVTGGFEGTIDLGNGPISDMGSGIPNEWFVASYHASGSLKWSRRLRTGGNRITTAHAIPLVSDVAVIGVFKGTIDVGTGPVTSHNSGSFDDVFIAILDSTTGTTKALKTYGGGGSQGIVAARSTAGIPDNQLVLAGRGGVDFGTGSVLNGNYATLFTQTPAAVWATSMPGISSPLAASYTGTTGLKAAVHVLMPETLSGLTPDGALSWSRPIPPTATAKFVASDLTTVFVAGEAGTNLNFGTGATATSAGVFLTRIKN